MNPRQRVQAVLYQFINARQLSVMYAGMRGEEKEYFQEKLAEVFATVSTMPKTYEQDGKGNNAIVYLHYFRAGMDWWITERDQENEQHQAFGLVDLGLGDGPELGYISIHELIEHGVELDLHWTPKTLREIKEKNGNTKVSTQ